MNVFARVSVCVLTYNPIKEKLIETLRSIVKQQNVDVQIIISDDGSKESCFSVVKEFLEHAGFENYKFVPAEQNQGTVKNVEKALRASDGDYVKLISPGDCLTNDTILSDWVNHLLSSKKRWSFCDAVCYRREVNGSRSVCAQQAHPQMVSLYHGNNEQKCRWNYVVLDDIVLGAATLCERELLKQYVQKIAGRVRFAEDHAYRLMMFDGVIPDYFPENAVLYEVGTGISTSQNEAWKKRLREDWDAADQILLSGADITDCFQKKMAEALNRKKQGGRIIRKIKSYTLKGKLYLTCKCRWNQRMTTADFYIE